MGAVQKGWLIRCQGVFSFGGQRSGVVGDGYDARPKAVYAQIVINLVWVKLLAPEAICGDCVATLFKLRSSSSEAAKV